MAKIIELIKNASNTFEILNRFDYNEIKQGNNNVDYGIVRGNNLIILIKVGMHGTIYGFENKYLQIAEILNKKFGCTVITVSTNDFTYSLENEMNFVREYANKSNFEEYKVYYMGHSFGGTLGLLYGYKYSEIKKILAINSPFPDDKNDEIIRSIESFNGESLDLVYGLLDDFIETGKKYSYLENNRIHFTFLPNIDHYFTNDLNQFVNLPLKYFF